MKKSLFSVPTDRIISFKDRVYNSPLGSVLDTLGVTAQVAYVFNWLFSNASDNQVSIEVNGIRADFEISNSLEYSLTQVIESGDERPVASKLMEEVRPDDTFWDVGANIGTYSCLVGRAMPEGTVVSFEPYEKNAAKLRKNLELNEIEYQIHTIALSDSEGTASFQVVNTLQEGTQQGTIDDSYHSGRDTTRVDTIDVKTSTGDIVVEKNNAPLPNVIKMDVEGAAPLVLDGMRTTIESVECRLIVIEPHDNQDEIVKVLDGLDFDVQNIQSGREEPTIFAYATS